MRARTGVLSALALTAPLFAWAGEGLPEMALAPIFSDHMVVAADRPLRVFGSGRGTATVRFRGVEASANALGGTWCVELPAGAAGGPYRLNVRLNARDIVIDDVQVGEVLLMAGQSNMQFKLGASASDPATWVGNPNVRSFSTRRLEAGEPFTPEDGWVPLTQENAARWSALGYETAIRRAAAKGCAIGIVNCYQGASVIQAWMDAELATEGRFVLPSGAEAHADASNPAYRLWNRPGALYRAQFSSVAPYSLTHVVWYQGESNTGRREGETYAQLLAALIGSWREDLRDVELPFTVVQLADYARRNDADWKAVQAAQAEIPKLCPAVAVVRAADVCETDDIHPKTKSRLAERISASVDALDGRRCAVPFARRVAFAAQPAARPRRLDRTWIFAERQLYGGHQNLLHIWADRPLFHDVGLRDAAVGGLDAAFLKDVGVLRAVGLDGFASLDHYPVHLRQLQRLSEQKEPVAGYSQMIVIPGYATEKDYPKIKNMILTAAKSPYTTRLDGKLVFWCYGWGEQGRHEWWAKRLRSDAEIPPFLFIGDMPLIDIYRAWNKHEWKGERTPEAEVAAFRKKVEDAIAVMDGFQVRCTEYYWDHLGDYEHRSEKAGFYRDYLLPIALEVMARPENRGKLLGTYVRQGYTNRFTGVVDGQYGTETLRNYLDEILLLNPDVLMCFEWNEAEENTHFQPTVANGTAYARVLAHYRALLDRKPFAPMPGDDTRIPNFVVSVRQSLRLGEAYRVELLYLPDGTGPDEIKAQIRIKDEDGRVLSRLPSERFATDRLTAITYRMPSEAFASAQALRVELVTDMAGDRRTWTAFDVTRIDATRCRNYLYSHHPLREQLAVSGADFRASPTAAGVALAAAVSAPEPLAAFEILDGTEEVAAADRENRFDRRRFAIFRGMLSAMDTGTLGWANGTVTVTGAPEAEVVSGNYPWEGFRLGSRTADGRWTLDCNLGSNRSNFFVCVPKGDLPNATLDLDLKEAATFHVPLADVNRLGRQAWQLATGVRLDLERADDLPDVPKPLNAKDASIDEVLPSLNRFPVYQPRAVSLSGKTWRGVPVLPRRPSGAAVETSVWSDYERRTVRAPVAADRLPVLDYRFTPEYGALLPCDAGRRWYATLGGATVYAEPMRYAFGRKRVPADFARADPAWERLGEGFALRFDGKGSYLALPAEVIPRGSAYALDFEICPEANGDYVLLRQQRSDGRNVGLQLVVADGRLRVSHFGVKLVPRHFDTGLAVPNGQWSHVRLVKDFESIAVTVNGQTFRTAYDRRADMFQGAVFGSNIEPGPGMPEGVRPFKGLLRQLSVTHGQLLDPTQKQAAVKSP